MAAFCTNDFAIVMFFEDDIVTFWTMDRYVNWFHNYYTTYLEFTSTVAEQKRRPFVIANEGTSFLTRYHPSSRWKAISHSLPNIGGNSRVLNFSNSNHHPAQFAPTTASLITEVTFYFLMQSYELRFDVEATITQSKKKCKSRFTIFLV